jgi:hypothetical protein
MGAAVVCIRIFTQKSRYFEQKNHSPQQAIQTKLNRKSDSIVFLAS